MWNINELKNAKTMSEKTIYQRSHRQLSMFEDDMNLVPYTSPKKGVGTVERLNDYEGFTEKFKPKKTTDDCYTPPAIYEAVLGWLKSQEYISDDTEIIRPFYPGNDYQAFDYSDGCVVVDNPPFSIYAQIVRWFIANGVKFFLFGPQLTLKVMGADVCYLPVDATITYENGAVVATGFVTNLIKGVRMWTAPTLHRALKLASPPKKILPKHTYPLNLITCATFGKISGREVDFKVMAEDCREIRRVESLARVKKSLFGGGWLLSTRAAAERAAAERAAGTCIQLSESELKIIEELDTNTKNI